jgi:hypothetical protein
MYQIKVSKCQRDAYISRRRIRACGNCAGPITMKMKFVKLILVRIPSTNVTEIGYSVGSQTGEYASSGI